MSGLDDLTREELVALAIEQHEVIQKYKETVRLLTERVVVLENEVEELRRQIPGDGSKAVPDWVKANRHPQEDKARKKREHQFVRHREKPTELRFHAAETCPGCKRQLSGGWVHRKRQVIDIPVEPVKIVEHIILGRYCGVCGKRVVPKVDLSAEVVGTHRVSLRVMSLVAQLHIVCRVPLRSIKALFKTLYHLELSIGELSEILHKVAQCGQGAYEELLEEVRGSPAVNADETGWRQDGMNGYLWAFCTPRLRYFVYDRSRSGDVPKEVLSEEFCGTVVSDFYVGYNKLLGLHQRCWVHLLRDLKELKEAHPKDDELAVWVERISDVYRSAKAFVSDNEHQRHLARLGFQEELLGLVRPYVKTDAVERVLAERMERYISELFTFVEHPEVPSENNAAERAIRPAVVARKVSGGTRSVKGSKTKATLMSLFATWTLRGLDTMEACRQMLIAASQPDSPSLTALSSHVA